jgi:ELWxxDGT repeat protein
MRVSHWLRPLAARLTRTPARRPTSRLAFRPRVEGLEDRTTPSAVLVKDINTTPDGFATLGNLAAVGSRVYFDADDRANGDELWVSDGTAAGTHMVINLAPGPASSYPGQLTAVGPNLFFDATADGASPAVLWVTDGTAGGTHKLLDQGALDERVAVGGWLYFITNTGTGLEVWRSDGTTANTRRLTDLTPGLVLSSPHDLSVGDQYVYFAARGSNGHSDVWRTSIADGTTARVTDAAAGNPEADSWVRAAGSTVYFSAKEGSPDGPVYSYYHGREVWASDGTPGTTRLVRDIVMGGPEGSSNPELVVTVGSKLYFTAPMPHVYSGLSTSYHPRVLWVTDGTAEGTKPLTGTAAPDGLTLQGGTEAQVLGGALFVRGGVYNWPQPNGYEYRGWWKIDADAPVPADAINAIDPYFYSNGVVAGGYLYLKDTAGQIWRSNGSSAGTTPVTALAPIPGYYDPGLAVGADVYFGAGEFSFWSESGAGLWKIDGATNTLAPVFTQVQGVNQSSNPTVLTPVGQWLYFLAADGIHGQQLWRTDGTAAHTAAIDSGPNPILAGDPRLVAAGPYVYFFTDNGDGTFTLARHDSRSSNSQAQTLVTFPSDEWNSLPYNLLALGQDVYFVADAGPDHGYELIKFNSSTNELTVFDTWDGPDSSWPSAVASGPNLYVTPGDGPDFRLLQRLDGPTGQLTGIVSASGRPLSANLWVQGDSATVETDFYFLGSDGTDSGLWRVAGSSVVADFVRPVASPPLLGNIQPGHFLTVAGGALYFVESDSAETGYVLWKCVGPDVTMIGTFPAQRNEAWGPEQIRAVGSDVYFKDINIGGGARGLYSRLWKTRGTPGDAELISTAEDATIPTAVSSTLYYINGATVVGSTLYYTSNDGVHGNELWRVNNPPVAAVGGPTAAVAGQTLTFTLTSTDPDQDPIASFDIDWNGDGNPDQTINGPSGAAVTQTFATPGTYTFRVRARDAYEAGDWASHTVAVGEVSADNLQQALPPGGGTVSIQAATQTAVTAFVTAVNGLTLDQNPPQPVAIVVDLGDGSFSGQTIDTGDTPNVTVYFTNGTYNGHSPALTVLSGNVVLLNVTLTNTTDAPTLRVLGGRVVVRNSVIQESTGYSQAAIEVTGGTVDLGTAPSPGGNTININGAGAFARNTTSTPIPAVGDTFTVNGVPLAPSTLSGTVFEDFNDDGQIDFGEKGIANVLITLAGTDDLGNAVSQSQLTDSDGAYVFLNLRPGSYSITESQPAGYAQGLDSAGTAGGSLSATDQFFIQLGAGVNGLNYNFAERPTSTGTVQTGQTAGIGFWNNKNGQALIKKLNGGTGSQLADWLAATLPNMFGLYAGSNNLTGRSNTYVAALFQQDFVLKGVKLDAQVLATALSVYVTNATLDSTQVAAQYGFTVSGDGVGTATVNVGSNGDAFGVPNNTIMSVLDLLLATNDQAVGGLLYNGNSTRRSHANNIYSFVNQAGDIG